MSCCLPQQACGNNNKTDEYIQVPRPSQSTVDIIYLWYSGTAGCVNLTLSVSLCIQYSRCLSLLVLCRQLPAVRQVGGGGGREREEGQRDIIGRYSRVGQQQQRVRVPRQQAAQLRIIRAYHLLRHRGRLIGRLALIKSSKICIEIRRYRIFTSTLVPAFFYFPC